MIFPYGARLVMIIIEAFNNLENFYGEYGK